MIAAHGTLCAATAVFASWVAGSASVYSHFASIGICPCRRQRASFPPSYLLRIAS